LTLAEVKSVSGEAGNFEVLLTQHPRYIDMEKCIACGICAEKCPTKVPSIFNAGLSSRKATRVIYAQAVPLKYAIDAAHCLYLTRGRCRACEKFCPTGAINFEDAERQLTLTVGAIVLAPGIDPYSPDNYDTFGYAGSPNIVTSLEFERMLSASGPSGGHLVRASDGKEPEKIAWLQCIGSRDEHPACSGACSSVCCTHAIKQAMLAKEHSSIALDTAIFYIDIRTVGKDFEAYYLRARDELGVRFVKARIVGAPQLGDTGSHLISYVDAAGRSMAEVFDLIVLSVGLKASRESNELARRVGIALNRYGFAQTHDLTPVSTSRPGIYVCGAFQAPKDIPSSVIDASAAAGMVAAELSAARWTRTRTQDIPAERDVRGQSPRIGVFICCCGTNIAGVVDVPQVVEYARKLPGVVHAEQNLFSCSQDTQDHIGATIREHGLNRIVVAACTPKTHEPLFQETLVSSGLNRYLFEMANIRNQCAWVHRDAPDAATRKAMDLVKMAVSKAALLEPLKEPIVAVTHAALVIGGGVAGMEAARSLSRQGYHTHLVEKTGVLGGQARHLFRTWQGEDVRSYLNRLIETLESDENIEIFLNARIERAEGFVGNFATTISRNGSSLTLAHGVTILATGASEWIPDQYFYGQDPRVVTGLSLQELLCDRDPGLSRMGSAVFIQCAGSRIPERPYCSKLCCTQSIVSALCLKELNPAMAVYVLYRDMRPYGLREAVYRKARAAGIVFMRIDSGEAVSVDRDAAGRLRVDFTDAVLRRRMRLCPELLVLASAIVPEKDNPLSQLYKIPLNRDGFFMEAHVKLRPVDCATDGVFVCGLSHGPKPIDESIAQAHAAAARAAAVLAMANIRGEGLVARIEPGLCSGCLGCIQVCPFGAISFDEERQVAEINPALCKGCGGCAAACPSEAPTLLGFNHRQLYAQINSALSG
jgi:heterodisulfide reductase subunit A2